MLHNVQPDADPKMLAMMLNGQSDRSIANAFDSMDVGLASKVVAAMPSKLAAAALTHVTPSRAAHVMWGMQDLDTHNTDLAKPEDAATSINLLLHMDAAVCITLYLLHLFVSVLDLKAKKELRTFEVGPNRDILM